MTLSLLHLNIYKGQKIDDLIQFIKTHNFDILHLQEVAGKDLSFNHQDCFHYLQQALPDYTGILAKAFNLNYGQQAYDANATFFKSHLKVEKHEIIWLRKNEPGRNFEEHKETEILPRLALAVIFKLKETSLTCINTHLAWSPNEKDTPLKLEQGKTLIEYIKKLQTPFILTGDFNVDANSHIVKELEKLAPNLVTQHHITNTLNPSLHRAKHLFPQGLAVDFIFPSAQLQIENLQLITENLSDHYALSLTCTL
jgi:endonuclease/exonuclease/phosphatase family metal-dependent hydrolase